MGFRNWRKTTVIATTFLVLAMVGCSSSPMQSRLEKNFVYQCSLELIDEDVPAGEAERVCSAAHRAEIWEEERQAEKNRLADKQTDAKLTHGKAAALEKANGKQVQPPQPAAPATVQGSNLADGDRQPASQGSVVDEKK